METKISDLQLAANLTALDYELVRIEGPNYRKMFVYKDISEKVALQYYQGQDKVSTRKLFGAYRDLR